MGHPRDLRKGPGCCGNWTDYLSYDGVELADADESICSYLARTSERDGLRAYVDFAFPFFYRQYLSRWGTAMYPASRNADLAERTRVACYRDLVDDERRGPVVDKMLTFLFNGTNYPHKDQRRKYLALRKRSKDKVKIRDRRISPRELRMKKMYRDERRDGGMRDMMTAWDRHLREGMPPGRQPGSMHMKTARDRQLREGMPPGRQPRAGRDMPPRGRPPREKMPPGRFPHYNREGKYQGGHSTSHDPALRKRLRQLVRELDAEFYNGDIAWLASVWPCQ